MLKLAGQLLMMVLALLVWSCKPTADSPVINSGTDAKILAPIDSSLIYPDETHFISMRQLTNGGDNAEAYWSFDDTRLIFQATREEWASPCDQIFMYDLRKEKGIGAHPPLLSTGTGRTTCSYFMPGNTEVIYASTHLASPDCPPVPERRADGLYVWPVYPEYDIFVAGLDGKISRQLTHEPGYDAEATVSPKGDLIVFTSMRSGDLELYTMDLNGNDVRQLTNALGYDGGAFFSPDGSKIIFRASRPQSEDDIRVYKELLSEGLVQPTQMELFICNIDGSELMQITHLGSANWAPFFHPSGTKVIFSSNHESKRGFPFNLYMINLDGTGLERITHDTTFDAFPMFSHNGKYLAFSSNRNNGGTHSTNLFIAEWKD